MAPGDDSAQGSDAPGQSIDARLAAMMDAIRSWDWRTAGTPQATTVGRPESDGAGAARGPNHDAPPHHDVWVPPGGAAPPPPPPAPRWRTPGVAAAGAPPVPGPPVGGPSANRLQPPDVASGSGGSVPNVGAPDPSTGVVRVVADTAQRDSWAPPGSAAAPPPTSPAPGWGSTGVAAGGAPPVPVPPVGARNANRLQPPDVATGEPGLGDVRLVRNGLAPPDVAPHDPSAPPTPGWSPSGTNAGAAPPVPGPPVGARNANRLQPPEVTSQPAGTMGALGLGGRPADGFPGPPPPPVGSPPTGGPNIATAGSKPVLDAGQRNGSATGGPPPTAVLPVPPTGDRNANRLQPADQAHPTIGAPDEAATSLRNLRDPAPRQAEAPRRDGGPSRMVHLPPLQVDPRSAPPAPDTVPPGGDESINDGQPDPEERRSVLPPRLRPFAKFIPWVVAAVAVIVIVFSIKHFASGQGPDALTPTSPTTTTSTIPKAIIPVSSVVKSQFITLSKPLGAASYTVTQALASSSIRPVVQVNQEVTPFESALNAFDFQLHYIAWPETMTVPARDLALRIQTLATFISSISAVNSATLSTWLTQLHALSMTAQSADNLVRKDIGLPVISSFP